MSRALALAAAAALLSGCVTGARLREQIAVAQADVKQARLQNAETCAPKELAVAEANMAFAQLELDQGDSFRAEEHLNVAVPAARKAVADSRPCAPVQVVIRDKQPEVVVAPPRPPPPPPPPKIALKDTDGDGVPDIDDLCPDVPGPKENRGCPWPKDRDGDGVPDDIDRCPDVAGPKENFGCPWPDRDHDGVPDKDDKCPDEPGPADNQGCPRKMTLIVVRKDRIELKQQVHFALGKSRILPASFELLRQISGALQDTPGVRVRVEGHTDNAGGLDRNMTLSQERADAVKDFLVMEGVQPRRLVTEGFGPTRPIKPNTTKKNRAANRRVDFRLIEAEKLPGDK